MTQFFDHKFLSIPYWGQGFLEYKIGPSTVYLSSGVMLYSKYLKCTVKNKKDLQYSVDSFLNNQSKIFKYRVTPGPHTEGVSVCRSMFDFDRHLEPGKETIGSGKRQLRVTDINH